jgi:hypothetical protein
MPCRLPDSADRSNTGGLWRAGVFHLPTMIAPPLEAMEAAPSGASHPPPARPSRTEPSLGVFDWLWAERLAGSSNTASRTSCKITAARFHSATCLFAHPY